MFVRVGRRRFLSATAAGAFGLGLPLARAEEAAGDLHVRELAVPAPRRLPQRALVLWPRDVPPGDRLRILVLLHGLGETAHERLGLAAWSHHYGLIEADHRLRHAPLTGRARRLTSERRERMNAELARRPYRGFVLVCPVTPNVYRLEPMSVTLDQYADWIVSGLLPAVRVATPAREDAPAVAIDGCSLGGFIALEVFLRRPEAFGAVGGVQAAIGTRAVAGLAARLRGAVDHVGPREIHLETSVWDPGRRANEALGRRLADLAVPNDLEVLPGGHDQVFLREVGTLAMLHWHDRRG